LKLEDFQTLKVIGKGSSGVVEKVLHMPSNMIYAMKVYLKLI